MKPSRYLRQSSPAVLVAGTHLFCPRASDAPASHLFSAVHTSWNLIPEVPSPPSPGPTTYITVSMSTLHVPVDMLYPLIYIARSFCPHAMYVQHRGSVYPLIYIARSFCLHATYVQHRGSVFSLHVFGERFYMRSMISWVPDCFPAFSG
jgi:hypothetical protein